MFRQLHVGATGMEALEKDMIVITNNVSNSKTLGFKRSRVEMENLFPQILDEAVSQVDSDTMKKSAIEYGSGVRVVGTPKDFSQGAIETTSNPLDLAVNGDGFFAVRKTDGNLAFTRAGNFHMDNEGNMVDVNGHILDPGIIFPDNTTSTKITQDGAIYIKTVDNNIETMIGQITVHNFDNPSGLESIGQNLYQATDSSGEAREGIPGVDGNGVIAQYSLESSNVEIIDEMMNMIITQRAFEIISKSIQIGENMMRSAIELAKAS